MNTQIQSKEKGKPDKLNKIGNVTIQVPFRKPGNVVEHLSVHFEVYEGGTGVTAFPILSIAEKRLVNLPESIPVRLKEEKVMNKDYKYIARDIVRQLQRNKL